MNLMETLVKKIDEMDELWKLADRNAVSLIKALRKGPMKAEEIEKLVPNSKVYLNELQRLGLISLQDNKFVLTKKGLTIVFSEDPNFSKANSIHSLFKEFLEEDKFIGNICVGYYEPHGDFRAITKDIHFTTYLTYSLGKYFEMDSFPVIFDVDVISKNLFNKSMIVVGGPVTNLVTKELNNFLPIRFVKEKDGWALVKKDQSFNRPDHGLIAKIPNPFNKKSTVLVLAGVRYTGTFAAILGLIKRADILSKNQTFAHVVRGMDLNNDGKPEDAEIVA